MTHALTYWQADPAAAEPSLVSDAKADVAIVGGGLAGLAAAARLIEADRTLAVTVLEARHPGFGASGRNAGIIEAPLLMPSWLVDGALPPAEARWAIGCLRRRVDREVQWLSALARGADLRPARILVGATSRLAAGVLRRAVERLDAAGVPAAWLSPAEAEAAAGACGRGALAFDGYCADPMGLVQALARHAAEAGARIHAGTRVTAIATDPRGGVRVETASGGSLRARTAVVCAGAWTSSLQLPGRPEIRPVATYMVASAPLPPEHAARLGGDGCCVSEVFSPASYRRVHDGRLLFGGTARVLKAADTTPEIDARQVFRLKATLRRSLPWLAGVELETSWGGTTSATPNLAPVVAPSGTMPGVIDVAGFHALMPAVLAGSMVVGLALGEGRADDEAERLRRAYAATRLPRGGALRLLVSVLAAPFVGSRPGA